MKEAALLLVDDDSDALLSLSRALKSNGLKAQIFAAANEKKAIELLSVAMPHVAVIDLHLTEKDGVESGFRLLKLIIENDVTCRVIVLTGHGKAEFGVRALNLGAANFIEKPADISHLTALINDGISQSALRRDFHALSRAGGNQLLTSLVGKSESWRKLNDAINYAASNNQPVLITGETGTGKGVCANAIHTLSRRVNGRFVRYQPNFTTADLVNSELFGHLKGSFTGAYQDRKGILAEARGGTLFLDEIDEFPTETQVSLLGVLQDRKYRALGSNSEEEADVRLICATNQNIEDSLTSGKIRKDFYHRIAHFRIHLAPLRERQEDIELLAEFFLEDLRRREGLQVLAFEEAALAKLYDFDWPGNIRQLEAVTEGAAYRAQYMGRANVAPEDVSLQTNHIPPTAENGGYHEQVREFKLSLIRRKLEETKGNQVKAAQELGLDRSTLRRLLCSELSD